MGNKASFLFHHDTLAKKDSNSHAVGMIRTYMHSSLSSSREQFKAGNKTELMLHHQLRMCQGQEFMPDRKTLLES